MNEEQFLPIAQTLVQYLLTITRNTQYSAEIRAYAVDVFMSCLDSLEMLTSTRREGIRVFVDSALPPWLETVVGIISSTEQNSDLKSKSIEAVLKLRLLFPSQLVHYLPAIFSPIYDSLKAADINDEESTKSNALQVEFIRKSIQAKIVVEEILGTRSTFEGCVALGLQFAQITQSLGEEWLADLDGFVEDLEETAFNTRHMCTDLIEDLQKINPAWTDEILDSAVNHYFIQQSSSTNLAREQESLLFIMNALQVRHSQVGVMLGVALSSSDPFLAGTGAIYSAQLGITACFEPVCAQLVSDNIVTRLCAIKAMSKFADTQEPLVKASQAQILNAILAKLQDLPDSALLMVAESVQPIIQLEPSVVLKAESPLPGLLNILAGCPGDISLISTVIDIFESLARTVDFEALCNAVIPVLLKTIEEEYALRQIALEILNGIIEGAGRTLPDGFVNAIWPAFSIDMEVEERQSVHEILRNLVKKAWVQIENGGYVDSLLNLIGEAFANADESESWFIPQLIISLIRQAGDRLASIMPKLLEVIVSKLRESSLSSAYQQSLISVFAEIAVTQAAPLIDFLIQSQGLDTVLRTWCEVFPDFHGYASIRTSIIGLSQIYATQRPELAKLEVKGDLIPDTSGKILTRSRAKKNPDRYTTVILPIKIVKLFLTELVNEMEGKTEDEEIISDSDWESTDLTKVIQDAQLNESEFNKLSEDEDDPSKEINTREFIVDFLKGQFGSGSGQEITVLLDVGEQETLHGAINSSSS